jgi:hypothetical protein
MAFDRDLYRVTRAVPRDLGVCGVMRRTTYDKQTDAENSF